MHIEKKVNYAEIVSQLSDLEIFRHYLGNFKIGQTFNSPLRVNKNTPACSIYLSKVNTYRIKDFGTGDNYSAIGFVQALFNLSYPDTLKKICGDFGLSEFISRDIITQKAKEREEFVKKETKIQIIPKPFDERALKYWEDYGISYDLLKMYNVFSVKQLFINKEKVSLKTSELCFAYFHKHTNHIKILRPEAPQKSLKWLTNTNNLQDIQGYYECDIKTRKPELLILTSSLKEVMLLRSYNLDAMAIHGENSSFDEDFIRHIKKYCKKIVSLYDFDLAGDTASANLYIKHQIPPIPKPEYMNCKDISDCRKEQGKELLDRFIEEIKSF